MTLEESIEKLEKTIVVAQENADKLAEFNKGRMLDMCDEYIIQENHWIEEVKERTELVEWLKDYKRLKALDQEPILDKIYADIQKLRGCSCSGSDGIIDDVEDILDKYKAESEDKV